MSNYEMYRTHNINAFIRAKHLEWAGHVWRSNGSLKIVVTKTIDREKP